MYAAIQILERAYKDCMAMQSSPEASSYVNQIVLAINLLKKHTEIMEKQIEIQLEKETLTPQT